MKRTLVYLVGAMLTLSFAAHAQANGKTYVQRVSRSLPLDMNGTFSLQSPNGTVSIMGGTGEIATVEAETVIHGVDQAALREGRSQTSIAFLGTRDHLFVKTAAKPVTKDGRWSSFVSYTIRVPQTVNIRISATNAPSLRISNIFGNVSVSNVGGAIHLQGVSGPTNVETINGDITASFATRPQTNVVLSTVNGRIELSVPPASAFAWTAETLKGDILAALPVQGGFDSSVPTRLFRATVNRGTAPVLRTTSVTGKIYLLPVNGNIAQARRLSATPQLASATPASAPSAITRSGYQETVRRYLIQPPGATSFAEQRNSSDGNFQFKTSFGNVFVGEVRGNANVFTRAGEIVLGRVRGSCEVTSLGGPINLGDIFGPLKARTEAGNILVRSARRGGSIATDGGNIQVLWAGSNLSLQSGGGDVVLQRAMGDVTANTRYGDIFITLDSNSRKRKVEAKTVGGNILLNVPPGFGADVEAVVITSDENANKIESELDGLVTVREPLSGNRTRIRASGKLNGGGEKVELRTEDGSIQIRTRTLPKLIITD